MLRKNAALAPSLHDIPLKRASPYIFIPDRLRRRSVHTDNNTSMLDRPHASVWSPGVYHRNLVTHWQAARVTM